MKGLNSRKGFSLVELLVTVGLLAIASVLVVNVMTGSTQQQASGIRRWQAQLTAESAAEMISSMEPTPLSTLLSSYTPASGVYTISSTDGTTNGNYLAQWARLPGLVSVQVSIKFTDPKTSTVAATVPAANQIYGYNRDITSTITFKRTDTAPAETLTWTKSLQPLNTTSVSGIAIAGSGAGSGSEMTGKGVCALLDEGTLRCWDSASAVGTSNRPKLNLNAGENIAVQAVGPNHGCGLYEDGSVRCWGDNTNGELGVSPSTYPKSVVARAVTGLPATITSVAVGYGLSCALASTTEVWCWGKAFNTSGTSYVPNQVKNGGTVVTGVTAISAGGSSLTSNMLSMIINPGSVNTWVPGSGVTSIGGITNATSVATSTAGTHACAETATGSAMCWGINDKGQLGDGTTTNSASTAKTVIEATSGTALTQVTDVEVGNKHSCALTPTGVYCWGSNHTASNVLQGQAGGTSTPQKKATKVGSLTPAAISAGLDSSCAIMADSTVQCWGTSGGNTATPTSAICF